MARPEELDVKRDEVDEKGRKAWESPKLEQQEMLPRVTNGFGGSFTP